MIQLRNTLTGLGSFGLGLLLAALLPGVANGQPLRTQIVARGLEHPWAIAFLPDGRFLVTERPGRMRIVSADGRLGAPISGVPKVTTGGQAGLLDVILDSSFTGNRTIYFCYSEPREGMNGTAIAKARLSVDSRSLEAVSVIFRQEPSEGGNLQYGCRIVEAKDGDLFVALGDRYRDPGRAQLLDNDLGKIIRITKEGAPAQGNPFAGRAGARPELWTYGHRNPQGLTLSPDGALWEIEHGPQGGDEVNILEPGRNYGWPVITYGEQYGGGKIGEGLTHKAGMEQPLHYWVPSIAPSGMAFLTSDRYGATAKGSLFVGSLKFKYVARLDVDHGKVVRETKAVEVGERVRDVRQGPDGFLYIATDEQDGKVIRLMPTP